MAIGPSGGPGDHVQGRVELEHSNECALAPNQHLHLAGKTAVETVVKQDHAKHDYVQVHILLIGFIFLFILNRGEPPTQTFLGVRHAFLPHVGQERVTNP